jgi:hypothetical protein
MNAPRSFPVRFGLLGTVAPLLLLPLLARAGGFEVKLDLPIRPKLSLSGQEKILVAPFLIGTKSEDEKKDSKIDLDREFRRHLQKQFERKTKLRILPAVEGVRLPSADLKKLEADAEFWKGLAAKEGADLIVTGALDFDVQDRSGYRREEYVSPIDGRVYYRQVLVNETGFGFDIVLVAIDGKSGAVLHEESFKDFRTQEGSRRDELAGLFENLFALESKILGIFSTRRVEAKRWVFSD